MIKKQILDAIKKYQTIIICRHTSPDPDALGSQIGLANIIRETFPFKNVYSVGVYPERLVHIGKMDNIDKDDYDDSLIIVLDTANTPRIDCEYVYLADYLIKIDHHPEVDEYGDLSWVDTNCGSTSQMIYQFYKEFEDELKINQKAIECLYKGIVADTNRFLYSNTTPETFLLVANMLEKGLDITKCYNELYERPLVEIQMSGYISSNLNVTENGLGHILITDEMIKELGADVASPSNMIGNFNNINEVIVWVFFTEDIKNKQIRVNIRSRGPEINDIAAKHGGGGHPLASGVRFNNIEAVDELIKDLDERCKYYKETL